MSENLIFFSLFQSSRPTSLKKENIQTRNRKLNKSKLVTSLSAYLSYNDAAVTSPSQQNTTPTSSWQDNFANHQQTSFYQQYSQSSYLMPTTTTTTAAATTHSSNAFRQLFKEEIMNQFSSKICVIVRFVLSIRVQCYYHRAMQINREHYIYLCDEAVNQKLFVAFVLSSSGLIREKHQMM